MGAAAVSPVKSVQLVDGTGVCSGRLEVKSNQSWASVCEADFDQQDAEVVCGELGCGAPAALQGGLYGEGEGQTWDKEFQCKGNESLLLDCDTSDRKNNTCLPGNAVGLTCSEPDDVRLGGGGSRCAGGLERYDQGEWRTVGADDWIKKAIAAVTTRRQKRVNRVSSMDLYVDANAMEMVSLSSRAEAGPGEERAAQGTE
ncbi:hypothetical protein J4Q44_G00036860 [Coregonus suidteri]|uniref:SRCR domain-containing protein n=1 Tax=Coregonus suidteri TaxID=861788 RepID=A0AAN8M764_9TELE